MSKPTTAAEWAEAVLKQSDAAGVRVTLIESQHLRELLADRDTFHRVLDGLVTAVREACGFDAGETSPEDAPWAAALDRLDEACTQIVDGLVAKGLWA